MTGAEKVRKNEFFFRLSHPGMKNVLSPIKKKRNGVRLTADERMYNDWVESKRARIENVWARLKGQFRILRGSYRGDLDDMYLLPQVCANLLNIDIKFRPLKRV